MAEESNKKSNINNEYNVAQSGLNLDNSQNNIKKGALSYALNAVVENFDANSVNYQNEPANEFCFDFPEGYKLVGRYFIPELNKIIFMLTNSVGGNEIGYTVDNDCIYRTLINSDCLNFDIFRPILGFAHRITNFGTEIYWSDNNGRRYLDIDNIPYIPLVTSDICDPEDSLNLDCNKLLLQPEVNIPFIGINDVISGGEITTGTYQFTIQYADAVGNPYTSYYGVTNPTPIADINIVTVNFNTPVGKSIIIDIKNLDPFGQFQYFNFAVIITVNNISSFELVGTYFIDDITKQIIYTGQNKTNIKLSISDIFEKFTFYDNADYVTTVQDILVWKGMTATERINYQLIANEIKLQWQSYRIPSTESYSDEANAANYRGYLRDEVYAFEVVFLLGSGKETDGFHIPGRVKSQIENIADPIDISNADFIGTPDPGTTTTPYWKVYNTATVEGTFGGFISDDDYKGKYQYGEFSYWESTEEYPCDVDAWGILAGEKIRHHKFPDVLVSPIIESTIFTGDLITENVAIFPIGVKIDSLNVQDLIDRSELTDAQKKDIIGYKIVRADRGVNKSIIAKGMLRNVGTYIKEEQEFFYPNYPYNDINVDPFLNLVNNAWSAECKSYTITVLEMTSNDDEGDYLGIEYRGCNNNRTSIERYRTLGVQDPVCSLTKPKITSPGVVNDIFYKPGNSVTFVIRDGCIGTVAHDSYDVYLLGLTSNLGRYVASWEDFIFGPNAAAFQGGQVPFQKYVRVVKGTGPPTAISGDGSQAVFTLDKFKSKDPTTCKEEEPLPPIKDNAGLASRQILNSPETSFGQPFLGNILKLESVMYGGGEAHFVEVKDNAKYKLLTAEAQRDALIASERVGAITGSFSVEAMFSIYQAYLTIYVNGITKRNYAQSFNSRASYNYSVSIPNDRGIKQRNLDIKRYLIPAVLSVGEEDEDNNNIDINNFQRETSVYLRTYSGTEDNPIISLPYPHESDNMALIGVEDHSRFTIEEINNCDKPEAKEPISVVSYYGSLKNEFINQYGQIYSYDTIDTGFLKIFDNLDLNDDIIFGGDTFIGRFAYKTKVPFFTDNRVNFPDESDIFYDERGNIAYPKFWHSARSILENFIGDENTGNETINLTNFISYKAHNFDCKNSQELIPITADPSTNPDRTYYDGYFYLFAYGIPSFYCESSYNLDLRTAFNNKEGEFWPHVSTGIPDEWLQETNVTIAWDNTYNYNITFSKQNKESVFTHLPADWGDGEDRLKYPFRAIYSDKQTTDADNRINNWLTYRPLSFFDFPQNYGELTALDGLKNRSILARFENKSLLYNNLLTIDTSNPQAAFVGNPNMFSAPPIDYAETDQGYVGSQNKFLLKIPYGAVFTDAKRGQVFLIDGIKAKDLTQFGSGMNRWFISHLPFEILKYYPKINTDNHYNSVGLHGVYDSNYERLILTKIDYIPLNDSIAHRDNKWYITEKDLEKEIFLIDSDYFCNVSWTVSFNFNTNSWISFHSYIPNFYVGENNFFYSGLNNCPNDFDALVGVIDDTLTTTTTTTVRILPTTTTTTTLPEVLPDCDFDVSIVIPDCDLEGVGIFVDSPFVNPCTRPDALSTAIFYWGYDLENLGLSVDSRISKDSACSHINYYLVQEEIWGYQEKIFEIEITIYQIGGQVFLRNFTTDCITIQDGWYFTPDTAVLSEVFRIESGEIVEIASCDEIINPTTTTTTTTLLTIEYCYSGIYTEPDPLHPLGGVITYIDEFGELQTLSEIWDVDTVMFNASSLITATGVIEVTCTTTTTTTV